VNPIAIKDNIANLDLEAKGDEASNASEANNQLTPRELGMCFPFNLQ